MMKIPSLLRLAASKQPIMQSLKPAFFTSSSISAYSTLQKVNVNVNVNVNTKQQQQQQPNNPNIHKQTSLAMLQQIIREQQKVNDIITSIQTLKFDVPVHEPTKSNNGKTQTDVNVNPNTNNPVLSFPVNGVGGYEALNRSARKARRANRGKRPVSRIARRTKRRRWGNHRRG